MSRSPDALQSLLTSLTRALAEFGLLREATSLELMSMGVATTGRGVMSESGPGVWEQVPRIDTLELLGGVLTTDPTALVDDWLFKATNELWGRADFFLATTLPWDPDWSPACCA